MRKKPVEIMKAQDLFNEGWTQVFCQQTGAYLGVMYDSRLSFFDGPKADQEKAPEPENKKQLKFF